VRADCFDFDEGTLEKVAHLATWTVPNPALLQRERLGRYTQMKAKTFPLGRQSEQGQIDLRKFVIAVQHPPQFLTPKELQRRQQSTRSAQRLPNQVKRSQERSLEQRERNQGTWKSQSCCNAGERHGRGGVAIDGILAALRLLSSTALGESLSE